MLHPESKLFFPKSACTFTIILKHPSIFVSPSTDSISLVGDDPILIKSKRDELIGCVCPRERERALVAAGGDR